MSLGSAQSLKGSVSSALIALGVAAARRPIEASIHDTRTWSLRADPVKQST